MGAADFLVWVFSGADSADQELEDPHHLHVQRQEPHEGSLARQPLLRLEVPEAARRADQGASLNLPQQ